MSNSRVEVDVAGEFFVEGDWQDINWFIQDLESALAREIQDFLTLHGLTLGPENEDVRKLVKVTK